VCNVSKVWENKKLIETKKAVFSILKVERKAEIKELGVRWQKPSQSVLLWRINCTDLNLKLWKESYYIREDSLFLGRSTNQNGLVPSNSNC